VQRTVSQDSAKVSTQTNAGIIISFSVFGKSLNDGIKKSGCIILFMIDNHRHKYSSTSLTTISVCNICICAVTFIELLFQV